MLEDLDEEFGDPDGDSSGTQPTEAMKAAEKIFVEAVLAEYTNHWCEDVYHEEVNVAEWVKAHNATVADLGARKMASP
jgi:hypothetical protein